MSLPAPACDAAPLLDVLERLVGFAPSDVLLNRLRRASALAAGLRAEEAALDQPGWAALLDALVVPETRMFRAAAQLEVFRAALLPELARVAAAEGRRLRLVSAGCATGEEGWTLAMLASGAATGAFEVLGLDLSRASLSTAEAARYPLGPPDPLREVPAPDRALLELSAGHFAPARALRPLVRFRRANLLAPGLAPGSADAILCRNVLIYMTEAARGRVLAELSAALRPGGALLLGPTDRPPPGLPLVPCASGHVSIWRVPAHG